MTQERFQRSLLRPFKGDPDTLIGSFRAIYGRPRPYRLPDGRQIASTREPVWERESRLLGHLTAPGTDANGEAFLQKWRLSLEEAQALSPLAALRESYERLLASHECCQPKVGCLVGNLAAEISGSSPACQEAMARVIASWREDFATYLRRGQSLREVRTDATAEALADFFWCAWEGSLLAMKIQGSTVPVRQCLAFLFNEVLPPRG